MNPKTTIRRHPERSVPQEFDRILQEGRVAHVGFCEHGQPYVMPFSYHYDAGNPRKLYLHGAHGSRTLQFLADGAPVCIEVTLVDGFVYSRTAIDHSINYRSVVCFGQAQRVTDLTQKRAIFEKMVARYFSGRTAGRDYETAPTEHLQATTLLEVQLKSRSAKARSGGPNGPQDADKSAPGSAGVLNAHDLIYVFQ